MGALFQSEARLPRLPWVNPVHSQLLIPDAKATSVIAGEREGVLSVGSNRKLRFEDDSVVVLRRDIVDAIS